MLEFTDLCYNPVSNCFSRATTETQPSKEGNTEMSQDGNITLIEKALRAVEKMCNEFRLKPAQNDNEVDAEKALNEE